MYPKKKGFKDDFIIAYIKNPENIILLKFSIDIGKFQEDFYIKIYNQVYENLWNSGIYPALVENSITKYKRGRGFKGTLFTIKDYEGLKERYTADQLASQEIHCDGVVSR